MRRGDALLVRFRLFARIRLGVAAHQHHVIDVLFEVLGDLDEVDVEVVVDGGVSDVRAVWGTGGVGKVRIKFVRALRRGFGIAEEVCAADSKNNDFTRRKTKGRSREEKESTKGI